MPNIVSQMLGSLVRYLLVALFGVLIARNVMSQETAAGIQESLVGHVVAIVLLVAPIIWRWLNARFNKKVFQAALDAHPSTDADAVKQRVLENNTAVVRV